MRYRTTCLLFCPCCFGLACFWYVVSQKWKLDLMTAGNFKEQLMETSIRSGVGLDDPISSIIRSSFNRDSLLQDFQIGRNNHSFKDTRQVELLTTNTSNGIQLFVDDPSNFIRYLRSPESVSDLIPALVCDVVFFCVLFGPVGRYSTLLQWRRANVNQHPGACLLLFYNDGSRINLAYKHVFKLLNHLFLIKAISDGRIITKTKYDELLQSGLVLTSPSLGRPALKHEDENSIKEFIRLLTPHMSSGIGIPSDADMSQYPSMFYLDMDTLFTNKSITVNKFLQRVDEGLKLQPILPSLKNETLSNDLNPHPYSSAGADFVISADSACDWGYATTFNSGVHLSRPTRNVAGFLMAAARNHYNAYWADQASLVREMQLMSDFNSSHMVTECSGGPRWYLPEYQNRIVFVSVLSDSTDPADQAVAKGMAEDNRMRNEHMESIWGPLVDIPNGSRVPLVVIVNPRWCNSGYKGSDGLWHPGDWIVHFTGFKNERTFGEPLRRWVCDNLDSVAHPEGWPSTPDDCPLLVKKGFNDNLSESQQSGGRGRGRRGRSGRKNGKV